jgi:tyrosinase
MDAGNFINSPVLDPILGFGGNGSGPNLCITDGPFKDYTNHVGPYWGRTDHCLFRRINDTHSQQGAQEFVDECMAQADYHHAWKCIEVRPHNAGHGGMGGQVSTF